MATSGVSQAAGLVVYRRRNKIVEYLMLQASTGDEHWTPPKGHLDPGESLEQAAIRETEEETGLKAEKLVLNINEDNRHDMEYLVTHHGDNKYTKPKLKKVTYWPAELRDSDAVVQLSHEHSTYKWAPLDEAKALGQYAEMITMLEKMEKHLTCC